MSNRKTQRAEILRLLLDARGEWVSLGQILELRIGQYGARIFELRRLGFTIDNKTERDEAGEVHSWYRLVTRRVEVSVAPRPVEEVQQPLVFGPVVIQALRRE